MATKAQLFAQPVKQPKYQRTLGNIKPYFNVAIKKAENNPRNLGVLSQPVESPAKANQILNNSIANNFWRWLATSVNNQLPQEKFVDFMQQRWAPIGAKNDPDNLNKNWAPNVRKFLRKQLGNKEYQKWQAMNLVMNNQEPENILV